VLVPGGGHGEYKRIGIVTACEVVWFSEDCEQSTAFRPGLKIDEADNMDINQVRKRETVEEWFKDVEEREITLV